jgi:hypothetical protein
MKTQHRNIKQTLNNTRKRSLSRKNAPNTQKQRSIVYNYIKKSVEELDFPSDPIYATQDTNPTYIRETVSSKSKKHFTKKPKVSKPTKTITMTIWEDGFGRIETDSSLRTSKETLSIRGSNHSKKTPQQESESVKLHGLSTTKPGTLNNSDNANRMTSVEKSEKVKKNTLKNSKSQSWFEKNPIYSKGKFSRLRKIKQDLDKQQNLINEINNIRYNLDKQKASQVKRSTSRSNRRNTVLSGTQNTSQNKKLISRSRSKTDFVSHAPNSNQINQNLNPQKTTMYTLTEKATKKLSRNNSRDSKTLKTKSFLKPSLSNYKTHIKKDSYCTYINSKTIAKKPQTASKSNFTYVTKKPKKKSSQGCHIGQVRHINLASEVHKLHKTTAEGRYRRSLAALFRMKSQEKHQTRNKKLDKSKNSTEHGLNRCGSVSYSSSVNSLRQTMSSRRKNIRKDKGDAKGESSLEVKDSKNFMKGRRSLGDNKLTFHQNSHSTLPSYTQDLREAKNGKEKNGKAIAASFGGIETITFNLSSKVKMLQTGHFF